MSPGGRWLAYTSDETGSNEIYVRSFPDVEAGGRWQVSSDGGAQPLWARNGQELFYRNGDRLSDETFASQLVGSWDLVEYDRRDESGAVAETYFGNDPLENLIYTALGDVSVHLVDSRVGEFETKDFLRGSPAEIKEAYEGCFGYFGTYTVDENAKTVTHHVVGASFRGYTGSDMTRFFELEGDRLSLVTGVEIESGVPSTFHLVWERRD